MERQHIKLTYESLIALLQGKDFHLITPEHRFIFHPPFDGVFLTHSQIEEIRYSGQMDMIKIIEKLHKYEESRDNKQIKRIQKDDMPV